MSELIEPEELKKKCPDVTLPTPDTRFSKLIRRIKWRTKWLFPNIFSNFFESESTFSKEHDLRSNQESRVPDSEELRIQIVWGVEMYGPSENELLCENLARLNWTAGSGSSKRDDASEWVRRQRSYGHGGWYNVGIVSSPNDSHKYLFPTNETKLPDNVDYLIVKIFQLTPALTSIVIGFILKEHISTIYESELQKSRVGYNKRMERKSILRISAEEIKNRDIINARQALRKIAQNWFHSHLPGYFCNSDIYRLPTAELITTATNPLLPKENTRRATSDRWRDIIALCSPYDTWHSSTGTGVSFTSRNGLKDDPAHLIICLCKEEVSDDATKYRGKRSNRAFISHSADLMDGIISNFAAVGFLTEALKNLRVSRASLKMHKVSKDNGLLAIEKIQTFFDNSLGTPVVAAELRNRSEHSSNFVHDCALFYSQNWRPENPPRTISQELCEHTNSLSNQVITEDHSLREHLEQLSSIISVRESIKAQRKMEVLTIFALIVAIISLGMATAQSLNYRPYKDN
ncbi:hypothetical protein EJ576_09000 [Pseudomonas sp. C 49-2]|uniref:hypothetical protein n=1 Tax=Pseudomonas sp. C 49-2 TaxID=2496849 RepID=UPI000F829A53|nr:hypothetical protein [Pseudomonas sp. C 49-2]RTY01717.1 hypothetical protein EJ576_09000 [Pseudomonas sp. C 49-2]